MGYIPDCENDIFISYGHLDNRPFVQGQKGWVSFFQHALDANLEQLLGAEVNIWRDAKLQGNDYISHTLLEKLPQIPILISVLSPGYIHSEWCMRELQEFHNAVAQKEGRGISSKSRIFKVIKNHVQLQDHPPIIRDLLGYEFFEIEKQSGKIREVRPELGLEGTQKFWAKLDDLAHDISELLKILKAHHEENNPPVPSTAGPLVYLAETTSDLWDEHDKIRRELQQRGCTILPDKPLPLRALDLQQQVCADLNRCKLSIHLIGDNYGVVPEGQNRSIIELQHELAASTPSAGGDFSQLIWLKTGLQTADDRHRKFIQALRSGNYAPERTELLETSLQELKTSILEKLREDQKNGKAAIPAKGTKRIYLICDQRDFDATAPFEEYLFNQGFEVTLPAFEGDEPLLREAHKENLLLCDAALIYYGQATDAWLNMKVADLQKISGYGRTKPMAAKAIYLGAPETKHKQRFRSHAAEVIKNFAPFSPDILKPFLDPLMNGKGGPS